MKELGTIVLLMWAAIQNVLLEALPTRREGSIVFGRLGVEWDSSNTAADRAQVHEFQRAGGQLERLSRDVVRERFSHDTWLVLICARSEFSLHPTTTLQPEHIIVGILSVDPAIISAHFAPDWTVERLRLALNLPAREDSRILPEDMDVPISPAVMSMLSLAVTKADELGERYLRPQHLLLALLANQTQPVVQLLREAGVTPQAVLDSLR